MKILLLSATAHEIPDFIHQNSGLVEILLGGVGMASTLYHLQKKLSVNRYDRVIQAGIAGCFSEEAVLGSTVLVQQDAFGDIGIEEQGRFTPIFETALAPKNAYPFTDGWLSNPHGLLQQSALRKAKAVTINKISGSPVQKQQLIDSFHPDIESMEGAAFHYVCLMEQVPFIQIRSISNRVGERDKSKWKMKEAIEHLNRETHILIQQIQGTL